MKNFIIAVVLLIALSIYFSFFCNAPVETALQNGIGTQYKGDSGLIIPGDGDSLANTIIEPENASVLIGETVALMVAIAWMKIKGCK